MRIGKCAACLAAIAAAGVVCSWRFFLFITSPPPRFQPLAEALPCGDDMRWKQLAVELYEKALAGPVEDFRPVVLSWPAHGIDGAGKKHRALELIFIGSLLMNRPCLVDMGWSTDNGLWIPKSVLWNVSHVDAKIKANYSSGVLDYIRNDLGDAEIGKNIGQLFLQRNALRYGEDLPLANVESKVLAPLREWAQVMPERVKMFIQSVSNMKAGTRSGCIWHFMYRMSEELRAQLSEALFDVAQKSGLLSQRTSLKRELNAQALADFFDHRYGNLWMPRATMTEAMTTLFPRIAPGAVPVYVAVHHRRRGDDDFDVTSAATMIPCAIAFAETADVKVIVESDAADFRNSVARKFPSQVICLDRRGAAQAYTEMVVLSLADKFVGSPSAFAFATTNLGFIIGRDVLTSRGGRTANWLGSPSGHEECDAEYRHPR